MGRSSCGLWNGTNKSKQSSKSHCKAHVLCLGHWSLPLIRLGVPFPPVPMSHPPLPPSPQLGTAGSGRRGTAAARSSTRPTSARRSAARPAAWQLRGRKRMSTTTRFLSGWFLMGEPQTASRAKVRGVLESCSRRRSGPGRDWAGGGGAGKELEGVSTVLLLPSSVRLWGAFRTSPGIPVETPFLLGRRAHRGGGGERPPLHPALAGGGNFLRVVFPGGGERCFLSVLWGHSVFFFFKQFWHQVCSPRLVLKWCLFPSIRNVWECGLWTREEM